ncbi:MAG: acyl transferase [bacterium]|nr:acyl transferase [bacterium]
MLKNENRVFEIRSDAEFRELSLELFHEQYHSNIIYKSWVDALAVIPGEVKSIEAIPFLPIEFFKSSEVVSSPMHAGSIRFTSSSTTSQTPATHIVNAVHLYEEAFLKGFQRFYGNLGDYCVLALLPNYLQRTGSSLVYMCDRLIRESGHPDSGFFLDQLEELELRIESLKKSGQKVLLIGVSYALMDLSDRGIELNENFIVMETGGMKGRRKELLKSELHAYLRKGFKIDRIHSEYGMTELLSQAYSEGDGLFRTPPWMKFITREIDDPLQMRNDSRTGGINVIDLANSHSCCFIATKDLGRLHSDGSLELMGRYTDSDVRGCNLMLDGIG